MKFSIIIPTFNRLEEVKELLASLEEIDFARNDFEVIFVDDGSTDNTKDFVLNYKSKTGLQIKYLHQSNKGPGEARNYGMREAHGDYFIFIDSDCLLPTNYLKVVNDFIEKHSPDAFGGPDTYHPSFSPLLKAINYSMTSFIGTGGTRGSKKSIEKKFYPRSFNMGISKEVFARIGGMGNLRHGQDMEYSARIYRNGFKVMLIPDAFVYHKRRTSLKKFFKQIFNWGVTRINLARLDRNLIKLFHLLPAFVVLFVIFALLIIPFNSSLASILWLVIGIANLLIILFSFFESLIKYKSIKTAFLSILTLYIQVFAYGMGLLKGLFDVMRGKKVAEGFKKNYYK